MRSRSDRVFGLAAVGVIAALPLLVGSVAVSNQVIVTDVAPEDLYAVADSVIVEGIVQGDLFVITGSLFILDLVVPDLIPFVDELLLGLATLILARWKGRGQLESTSV